MDRKDLEAKVLQAVACVMPEIDISKLDVETVQIIGRMVAMVL